MQTICFDFYFFSDGLPSVDADTMLAQAQLPSCLACENRHSGGCALLCIPVHQGEAKRGLSIHVLSATKGKNKSFLLQATGMCVLTSFPGPRHTASSGVTEFIPIQTGL